MPDSHKRKLVSTNALRMEVEQLANQFKSEWNGVQFSLINRLLIAASKEAQHTLFKELLQLELEFLQKSGRAPKQSDYLHHFPTYDSTIQTAFADDQTISSSEADHLEDTREYISSPTDGPAMPTMIGKYKIQKVLGKGSFGIVYLGRDPELDRLVAIKIPKSERFRTPADLNRFVDEARSAALLRHPAIVTVYDVDREDDSPYIVQEYVEGRDLTTKLKSESLSQSEIARICSTISDALDHSHRLGLVHRDLKPDNILMDKEGNPCVADFGLAVHEHNQCLRKGEVAGTPRYMSPEQVRGETHLIDGRTDIWSLGVILYFMLTGKHPFTGHETSHVFDEIKHRPVRPPRQIQPTVSPDLERICLKCLNKDVQERYTTASDIGRELRRWLASQQSNSYANVIWISLLIIGVTCSLFYWSGIWRGPVIATDARELVRGEWSSWLEKEPEPLVYLADTMSSTDYNASVPSFQVISLDKSLFTTGRVNESEFRIRSHISLQGENPHAGFFLSTEIDQESLAAGQFATIYVGKSHLLNQIRLYVELVSVKFDGVGTKFISSGKTIAAFDVEIPVQRRMALEIYICDGYISEANVNGQRVLVKPRVAVKNRNSEIGVFSFGGHAVFQDFSVKSFR